MLVARRNPRRYRFERLELSTGKTLSVFVDESGRFQHPDRDSRFYIVGMVFHNQCDDISSAVEDFRRSISGLGLDPDRFVFHAGPLIRREKGYEFFSRNMRGRIYNRMMTFARRINFKCHCLIADKKYVNSALQIVSRLQAQFDEFLLTHKAAIAAVDRIKVYYDYGQSPVTKILQRSFTSIGDKVEFAIGVQPRRYMLFQLADLICTLNLVALKIRSGDRLTDSEYKFFGGKSAFRRNEAKFLAAHAILADLPDTTL